MIIITSVIYKNHYINVKNFFNTNKTQLEYKFNKFMTNWPKLMKKQWELSTQMQHEFNTNSTRRYVTFSNHEISKT